MTTAAELASYASSFPSFRNRIINGNLSNPINQRGAGSITASTGYTYDRWYYDGSTYLYQGIEDKNVNNGTYVISWEGAGINAAWKVSTDTTAGNGPDATTGFTSVSNGGTFTVNEGTEYSKHLWIRFDGTLADLDKVQVEEGTVPTPFEHRPIGMELSLCQRYFMRVNGRAIAYRRNDNLCSCFMTLPQCMRLKQPVLENITKGLLTNMQSQPYGTINDNSIAATAESEMIRRGFLYIEFYTNNTGHTFIPSWEGFNLDVNAEL